MNFGVLISTLSVNQPMTLIGLQLTSHSVRYKRSSPVFDLGTR